MLLIPGGARLVDEDYDNRKTKKSPTQNKNEKSLKKKFFGVQDTQGKRRETGGRDLSSSLVMIPPRPVASDVDI